MKTSAKPMLILTLRTDKPESEIGLFDDTKKMDYKIWTAHRQLAETIHNEIHELLKKHGWDWPDLKGLVVYSGPGSFTGLRIGLTVANTLAESLSLPIIGETGEQWLETGIKRINASENDQLVLPQYGQEVHITAPKK